MNAPTVQMVKCSEIRPGDNDRRSFNTRELQALADSIRDNGLAQPITVRPVRTCGECGTIVPYTLAQVCPECGQIMTEPKFYQIVAGERRFRACSKLLGWETIPAIVRELSDEEADAIMLTENVHRVDLNPIDEGHAYSKRIERHSWAVAEVARRANVSEGRVKNRLSLLELRPEAQKLVADGHLALGFAEEMSVLDNNRQLIALRWLQQQKSIPSRRTFAAMVGQLYQEQCQESLFDLDSFFAPGVAEAVQESETGRLCDILPRIDGLPGLPIERGGIGKVIDAYIASLLENGRYDEANVLVDFWGKLVQANYANISPYESKALAMLHGAAA